MELLSHCVPLRGLVLTAACMLPLSASFMASAQGPPTTAPAAAAQSPPTREELTRSLIVLRSERDQLVRTAGRDDPRVRERDAHIAQLQQSLSPPRAPISMTQAAAENDGTLDSSYVFRRVVAPSLMPAAGLATATSMGTGMSYPPLLTVSDDVARESLDSKRITLTVQNLPLEQVLGAIADRAGCSMEIHWKALEAAGVDRKTPVSSRLLDVPCRRALADILDNAGGGTATLAFTIDDGILVVGTREDLSSSKYQTVRIYDVRDLIAVPGMTASAETIMALYQGRITSICDLIKSTVAPDTWRDNGGTIGSIREFDGLLIIQQTHEGHADVETLLARIRKLH